MTIARRIYGFLSQSFDVYNISIPWTISNQDGMFKMNHDLVEATRQNLIAWAKTNQGERPMDFSFGLDLKRALFEPEGVAVQKILSNATNQLSQYFPFLNVEKLEVLTHDDDVAIVEHSLRFILEANFKTNENKKIRIDEVLSTNG